MLTIIPVRANAPKLDYPSLPIVSGNALLGIAPLPLAVVPHSLTAISSDNYFDDVIHVETLKCLIKYESSGNPNAIGDNGKAKGILQFHRPTFERYCVNKYGFENDIMNPEIQIKCADAMLRSDPDNIQHWTPWRRCIK